MSIFTYKDLQSYALDRRYFAAFLIFQGLMVAGSILYTPLLPALLTAAFLATLFVAGVFVRPWLIVPLIVLTTGLDSTGRLIGEAGKIKGVFHLTGFHLTFGLMIIALAANICLSRRVRFPDFELKAPLLLFLGCIAVSLTYSPNQPEATVSFVRMCALVLFTYMIQVIIDSKPAVSAVLWSLVVFTVAGAVMGTYQVVTGQFHLPVKVITALGGNVPRATGTFHNPNIFASFMMSGVLPLLAVLLNYKMPKGQRVVFAVFFFETFFLAAAFLEAFFAAFFLAFFTTGLRRAGLGRVALALVFLVAAFLAGIAFASKPEFEKRAIIPRPQPSGSLQAAEFPNDA